MRGEVVVLVVDDALRPGIDSVLGAADVTHRQLDRWLPDAEVLFGAVAGDELVGLAGRRRFALHPVRDWVAVHVLRSARGRGVGRALFEAVRRADPLRPLKVRLPAQEVEGAGFARRRGFISLVSSVDVVLVQVLPAFEATRIELEAVASDDHRLLRALGRVYTESHRWDPCAPLRDDDVRRLLVGPDAISGTAHLAVRNGEVIGAGLAYRGAATSSIELANLGAVEPDASDAVEITHALVDAVARPFLNEGLVVSIECDRGAGSNTGLDKFLQRVGGTTTSTVDILATPN